MRQNFLRRINNCIEMIEREQDLNLINKPIQVLLSTTNDSVRKCLGCGLLLTK